MLPAKPKPGKLVLVHRLFYGFTCWQLAYGSGAKLAWRVKSNLKQVVQQMLPDGLHLNRVFDSSDKHRSAGQIVLLIDYTLQGSASAMQDRYRLVPNILDPMESPAQELAALDHERWAVDGFLDEFKTYVRANSTVLRSKTPCGRSISSRGRSNPRGVKRKMKNFDEARDLTDDGGLERRRQHGGPVRLPCRPALVDRFARTWHTSTQTR